MRVVHYKNIGYPKTGTTWLWTMLMSHPLVDGKMTQQDKEYAPNKFEFYKKKYEKYNVTVNLNPMIFYDVFKQMDYNHPKRIHEYTTHLSFTFRNFYEVISSTYNMQFNIYESFREVSPEKYVENTYKNWTDIKSILSYWKDCEIKIKYFLYDDLVKDPKNYFFDICDYLGLKRFYKDIGIIYPTVRHKELTFTDKQIQYINNNISILEDILDRDLSHWKK